MTNNLPYNNNNSRNSGGMLCLRAVIKLGKQNQKAEVTNRIRQYWSAFGRPGCIFKNKDIPMQLNRNVLDVCILLVPTYGIETMTLVQKNAEKLRTTQRVMERTMQGINLRDRRNTWHKRTG